MNLCGRDQEPVDPACPNEIIEIGAVILNQDLEQKGVYKKYVKPVRCPLIHESIVSLTGITDEAVADAPQLLEAMLDFEKWCRSFGKDYEVFAWSENDLRQVREELASKALNHEGKLDYMFDNWHDFQDEFRHMLGYRNPIALNRAVDMTEQNFEGRQHDACDDALNTARLYIQAHTSDEFMAKLSGIKDAMKPYKPATFTLGDMLKSKLAQLNITEEDDK